MTRRTCHCAVCTSHGYPAFEDQGRATCICLGKEKGRTRNSRETGPQKAYILASNEQLETLMLTHALFSIPTNVLGTRSLWDRPLRKHILRRCGNMAGSYCYIYIYILTWLLKEAFRIDRRAAAAYAASARSSQFDPGDWSGHFNTSAR